MLNNPPQSPEAVKKPRLKARTGGYRAGTGSEGRQAESFQKCRAATFSSFIHKDAKTM
jgi:hypothetical protein